MHAPEHLATLFTPSLSSSASCSEHLNSNSVSPANIAPIRGLSGFRTLWICEGRGEERGEQRRGEKRGEERGEERERGKNEEKEGKKGTGEKMSEKIVRERKDKSKRWDRAVG